MARNNFTPPKSVADAHALVVSPNASPGEIALALSEMTSRYNKTLREMHLLIENYNRMLDEYGPFYQVDLGEPLSRFENILRKAYHE